MWMNICKTEKSKTLRRSKFLDFTQTFSHTNWIIETNSIWVRMFWANEESQSQNACPWIANTSSQLFAVPCKQCIWRESHQCYRNRPSPGLVGPEWSRYLWDLILSPKFYLQYRSEEISPSSLQNCPNMCKWAKSRKWAYWPTGGVRVSSLNDDDEMNFGGKIS